MKKLILSLFISLFILMCSLSGAYAKSDDTYDTLRMMIDIMEIIDNNYVEEKQPKDLVIGAIHGIVRTLDPYSQFMDEKAYKEMKTETEGSFGGVGIKITMQDGELTVITPIPDTPAYFSGILPEDRIVKIDDKSTENMSMDEAVKLMRGNPGTKVVLTIFRPSTKEEIVVPIKRKKIKIETVKKQMLEDNIGYIRLSEFNAQSAADIKKMLGELTKDGMKKGFILDLRNNPGGLLDSAVNICELFIKEGSKVVSTKGRDNSSERIYYTKNKPAYQELPMVVLINRGSASASEIVTGTLQDYKRALVIGGNSFGKGSVQTIVPLADGNALRLTIAKYYLPSGRTIQKADKKKGTKSGVTPDILMEVSPEVEGKLYMQSEVEKKNKNDKKEKIKDEVLDAAIKIIKEGNVKKYINEPQQYIKDNPVTDKTEPENKDENSGSDKEEKIKKK